LMTGAVLITSGRVPKTEMTFIFLDITLPPDN